MLTKPATWARLQWVWYHCAYRNAAAHCFFGVLTTQQVYVREVEHVAPNLGGPAVLQAVVALAEY